jgi:hypothetical protein
MAMKTAQKSRFGLGLIMLLALVMGLALTNVTQAAGLPEPIFEGPVLITSVGQSADGQLVKVLADRVGLAYTYDTLALASAVKDFKTLILVVGGSSKGLGAAGINQDQEEARAKAMIAAAKDAGTKILFMHVGGEARRGDLTDRFVTIVAATSQYLIIVADGNKDGFMTNAAGGAPLDMAETIGDAGRFLKAAFK